MTGIALTTYDQNPPVQPTAAVFNDCAKIDDPDPDSPPLNPSTDLSAAEFNQLCSLAVAYAQMIPPAIIGVTGATPAINFVLSTVQAVNGQLGAFTLTRTVGFSAGGWTIEWGTSTTLPAQRGAPLAFIIGSLTTAGASIAAQYVTGPTGKSAIAVTTTVNGAYADMNWAVVSF